LQDARRNMLAMDSKAAARTLADVTKQIDSLRLLFEPATPRTGADSSHPRAAPPRPSKTVAYRAALGVDQLKNVVGNWYRYYDGYDPQFSWWIKDPYRKLDDALTAYARTLRERVVGYRPTQTVAAAAPAGGGRGGGGGGGRGGSAAEANEPIIGDPIGADGLKADLVFEMIPYTPEELIGIAE